MISKWFKILKIFIADNKENISIVEYKTLQKQLDERNAERDELLFTIRVRSSPPTLFAADQLDCLRHVYLSATYDTLD